MKLSMAISHELIEWPGSLRVTSWRDLWHLGRGCHHFPGQTDVHPFHPPTELSPNLISALINKAWLIRDLHYSDSLSSWVICGSWGFTDHCPAHLQWSLGINPYWSRFELDDCYLNSYTAPNRSTQDSHENIKYAWAICHSPSDDLFMKHLGRCLDQSADVRCEDIYLRS